MHARWSRKEHTIQNPGTCLLVSFSSSQNTTPQHFFFASSLPLLVLGLLIRKAFPCRHKLAQLPTDHLLSHEDLLVELAIVDAELVADQLRRDGGGALLCADRRVLARGDLAVDLEGEDVGPCLDVTWLVG